MIISVPSTRWFFSGDTLSSGAYARTGRRLAYTPSAWRILSSPFSGRFSGGASSNSGRPTAPISVASAPAASRSVSSGNGVPVLWIATPPKSPSRTFRRCPHLSATCRSTSAASPVTSAPIPSPGRTRIFRSIALPYPSPALYCPVAHALVRAASPLMATLGSNVLHLFEFFSPCEDFVILVEQAFQRALVSLVCFLRASAPPVQSSGRLVAAPLHCGAGASACQPRALKPVPAKENTEPRNGA